MFGVSAGDAEEKSAFLTYLLTQKSLTPEEANLHAVDLMTGAVETVRHDVIKPRQITVTRSLCLSRTVMQQAPCLLVI